MAAASASNPWRTYRRTEYAEPARSGEAWASTAESGRYEPSHAARTSRRPAYRPVAGAGKPDRAAFLWWKSDAYCAGCTHLRLRGERRQQCCPRGAAGSGRTGKISVRCETAYDSSDKAGLSAGTSAGWNAPGDACAATDYAVCAADHAATAANDYAGAPDIYSATSSTDVSSGATHVGAPTCAAHERASGWRTSLGKSGENNFLAAFVFSDE
jgi:hypothetical protein